MQKRSLTIAGHRTSLALEPEFWAALSDIAIARGASLAALVADIDRTRGARNLASSCRLAVLDNLRSGASRPESAG